MAGAPEYPLPPEELRRRLGKMREGYLARAPGKIAQIEALWQRVGAEGLAEDERDALREELVLAVHTMVGSAPTLGCEALGRCARALEAELRAVFASKRPLSESEREAVERLIAALGPSLP